MEIEIDDKWKLETDATGWKLKQFRPAMKGKNRGQLGWYDEGHYDTLHWALRGLYKGMLHEGFGRADILELADRIEQVEERILRKVDDYLRQRGKVSTPSSNPWDKVEAA